MKQLQTVNIANEARAFVQTIKDKTDVLEQYSADQVIQATFALNEADEGLGVASQRIIDYLGVSTKTTLQDLNIGLDFVQLNSLKTDALKAQRVCAYYDSCVQVPIRPLLVSAAQHTCQGAESLRDMLALGLQFFNNPLNEYLQATANVLRFLLDKVVVDDFQSNEGGVLVPHVGVFLRQLRGVDPEKICSELCGTDRFNELASVHVEKIRKISVHEEVIDSDLACFQAHSDVLPEFYEPVEQEVSVVLGKMGLVLDDLGRAYYYFLTRPGEAVGGFMWAIMEGLQGQ